MVNAYSRRFEIDFVKRVYDKIAGNIQLKKIHGEFGDNLLIRGSSENLILVERNSNKEKEIIKIHSKELEATQLKLESIIGISLSQYRIH